MQTILLFKKYFYLNFGGLFIPGVWQLKVIYKESLLAQLLFPIFPLQYVAGQPIVIHQTSYLHSGLNHPQTITDTYSKFLPNATVKLALQEEAQRNSLKQNEALVNWIDRLFRKFYVVDKVCVDANAQVNMCHTRVNPCRTTSWSSLAPDPKSAIGEVNATTGMFDVW